MTPLDHALALAAEGYAVFPCRLSDKTPCTPHSFKDATDDPDAVRELWRCYPGRLVGVATGAASQIVVLDFDTKPKVIESSSAFWSAHKARLLPTRQHLTRSGGIHLLYTDPGGLKCSASKIAKGVDVRADGGYAIWWPAAGLEVPSGACAPAPWPSWLTEALAAKQAELSNRLDNSSDRPSAQGSAYAKACGLIRTVVQAAEGERNCILFWAACRAVEMTHDGEVTGTEAAELMAALRRAGQHAGLPLIEIDRTLRSAGRAH